MQFSSLPSSQTSLSLPHSHPSSNRRHSFWSSLRISSRSSSARHSNASLINYSSPLQRSLLSPSANTPSLLGPSRVIAIVGNIRSGIARLIIHQLLLHRFVIVALIDKPDPLFSRSLDGLASCPSFFHAFVLSAGLFDLLSPSSPSPSPSPCPSLPPQKSKRSTFQFSSRRKSNLFTSHPSHSSSPSPPPSSSTHSARSVSEVAKIFGAYRVDTVICCFEPQIGHPPQGPSGPRAAQRAKDEVQFGLEEPEERARIEAMERAVLEASLQSGTVARFAVTVHPTSLAPSPLSPPPTNSIRPHLRLPHHSIRPPPISITEFRWGFLMNELASDPCLVDGPESENGLGKHLIEPPRGPAGRCIIDFENKKCLVPLSQSSSHLAKGKAKHRPEPVCLTLAEDVARFISLACKLREPWCWNMGRMVGDTIRGGWEEVVDLIERVSCTQLEREYTSVGFNPATDTASSCADSGLGSGSSKSSWEVSPSPSQCNSGIYPSETMYAFEDRLRARLAEERLDATSVQLSEFVRVWFTPLARPPVIPQLRGPRNPHSPTPGIRRKPAPDRHHSTLSPPPGVNPQAWSSPTEEQKEWLINEPMPQFRPSATPPPPQPMKQVISRIEPGLPHQHHDQKAVSPLQSQPLGLTPPPDGTVSYGELACVNHHQTLGQLEPSPSAPLHLDSTDPSSLSGDGEAVALQIPLQLPAGGPDVVDAHKKRAGREEKRKIGRPLLPSRLPFNFHRGPWQQSTSARHNSGASHGSGAPPVGVGRMNRESKGGPNRGPASLLLGRPALATRVA